MINNEQYIPALLASNLLLTNNALPVEARACVEKNVSWIKRKLDEKAFSELQGRFFYYLNEYQDILFTNRTVNNSLELKRAYLLHIVNHILK